MTVEAGREPIALEHGRDALQATLEKAKWRIVPFLFLCFVVNYVDRSNVGLAKLHFQNELGFSDAVYGLGVSFFFVGFLLFEVPSNLLLARIGARKTLSRIMVLWGLASIALMIVKTPFEFYLARFLVGVFEAGFVPGVLYYLSQWFPSTQRARITSMFMVALPISGIMSNPLSGWLMSSMNGFHGLAGWQWLFLVEGLPSVILGSFAFLYLSDTPETSSWLDDKEKRDLAGVMERDRNSIPRTDHSFVQSLRDVRIYGFAFCVFTQFCVVIVFAYWGPTILRGSGVKDVTQLGLLNTIPFLVSMALMLLAGWHSDRKMERPRHAACGQALTVAGLILLPVSYGSPTLTIACLAALASGHYVFWSVFWTIPPTYLSRSAAPGGIALINSLGATGGFFASNFLGWIETSTGTLTLGFYSIAVLAALGALTLLLVAPKLEGRRVGR
ncbi:MFS transporter [Bradyrhizobium jicamae]|uniref:MFS transporter n=1 Tax=Bradyrhizobium jicamae TaxID=280332 RepID=UPI001BA75AB9|nr:MFS transporter [Bradyrhizobium jicamae]MBR0751236.1 MFS transporter [Bradyrhizobium jicamae]